MLKFYSGSAEYRIDNIAEYAFDFNIIANKNTHKSPPGTTFSFQLPAAQVPATQPATQPQTTQTPAAQPQTPASQPPAAQAPSVSQQVGGRIDPALIGKWHTGQVSGGLYNRITGRYEGTSGIGLIDTYNADGTYTFFTMFRMMTSLMVNGSGNYTAENGVIKKTNIIGEASTDEGKTYGSKYKIEDSIEFYSIVIDANGETVLLLSRNKNPPTLNDSYMDVSKYRKMD